MAMKGHKDVRKRLFLAPVRFAQAANNQSDRAHYSQLQHSSMAAKAKIKTREQKRKGGKEEPPEEEPF